MRVSIVTVSYNQVAFVEAALKSVLGQKGADIEYIVMDGGSADGTREVIARYEKKLAYAASEKDGGPAAALNSGFARASGQIFGYVNSDDLLLQGSVSEAVQVFEDQPDADVVYAHGYIIDADGRVLSSAYSDKWSVCRYAAGACVVLQPATFIRAEAFRAVGGFREDASFTWDGQLLVDIGLNGGRMRRVDRRWAAFRLHGESITGSGLHRSEAYAREKRRIAERIRGEGALCAFARCRGLGRVLKWASDPRIVGRKISERLGFRGSPKRPQAVRSP